ncbi:MAG: hypothetical protein KC466_12570, partial [Myxococcales bacterium]|nr:hypothetical protein [Myxococcales bacterium]
MAQGAFHSGGTGGSFDRCRFILVAMIATFLAFGAGADRARAYTVDVTADAGTDMEPIDPLIFGGRFEWPGFYNGWPQSVTSQADYYTHIKRWYSYLPTVYETRPTMVRYPGGRAFALTFAWKKSIGRFENRALLTPTEQQTQPDKKILLGIEEGIGAIEDLGATPAIVAPILGFCFGSQCVGYPQDNADLVEYLNQPNDGTNPHPDGLAPNDPLNIDWAARRAANGHPAPYNVKYFDLGSETRHSLLWTPQFYASQFCLYCTKMKAIDPTIECGAVGSDSPYYTDPVFPNPFDRWESWFEDVGNEITAQCGAEHLSYWQRIDYTPGTNDTLGRGWSLYKQFVSTDVVVDFPTTDTWTMKMFGAGGDSPLNNPVDVGIYLDSVLQTTVTLNQTGFHDVNLPVTAGSHTIRFRKEDAQEGTQHRAVIMPLLQFTDSGAAQHFWYDSLNQDQLWDLAQGGHVQSAKYVNEPQVFMHGAPTYQTEWGIAYATPDFFRDTIGYPAVFGQNVRDMLNFAGMFHNFVDKNIPNATNYIYFEEGWHGLIEGVGTDTLTGEMGRPANTLRRRPNFYAFKLYRDNVLGHEIAHTNNTPEYLVGATVGRALGDVGLVED